MFQGNRIFSYSGKEIHIILKSAFADFREIESYFGVANSMYLENQVAKGSVVPQTVEEKMFLRMMMMYFLENS